MAKKTVLIIEDEKNILELVTYNLEQEGYQVSSAMNGEEGLVIALSKTFDLFILDLMLPGMGGLEICKTLRQNPKTKNCPIIMLTAKSEELDKVLGLELGADDYMTKPFSPRELLARIKAVIRRYDKNSADVSDELISVGNLEVDRQKHQVKFKGTPIDLTSKEYSLLKVLLESGGRVLSREQLLNQVWGYEQSVNIETRTVDMHIGQLRKKIKSEADRIITVKNAGYRFDDES